MIVAFYVCLWIIVIVALLRNIDTFGPHSNYPPGSIENEQLRRENEELGTMLFISELEDDISSSEGFGVGDDDCGW